MPRYRFVGDARVLIPDLNREVEPGEEFESELAFSPAIVELIEETSAGDPPLEPEPEKVA